MARVTILTWNVWFGGHRFDERCEALVDRLYRADADLIALQEVTPELLAHISAAPWAADYERSDPDGEALGNYGVLLLSRVGLTRVEQVPFPTGMGRSLVVAEAPVGGAPLTFASAHLESQDEDALRAEQLRRSFAALGRRPGDCLFVGDMNFVDGAPLETAALDPAFADVWPALRPGEPGYTVDTEVNRMRWIVKEKVTRKRIDRVLRRGALRPLSIELYGDRCVGGDPELFASDHFGLRATFER